MPDNAHIAVLVAASAAVTWALRALPFAALAPVRRSALVGYLSVHMPVGVMAMLALYALRDTVVGGGRGSVADWVFAGAAVAVTVGAHLWRNQAVLSIVAGTGCYVALMSVWG